MLLLLYNGEECGMCAYVWHSVLGCTQKPDVRYSWFAGT